MRQNVKRLSLRLTADEYAHLQRQAAASGLKLEPMLRQMVMGTNFRPRPPDTYAALLRELSAIGNNINQIAHNTNASKCVTADEIQEAVRLTRQAWRLVKDAF